MRPPVVKRQPPPRSELVFFPTGWSWSRRHEAPCADCLALARDRRRVSAPHTSCGAIAMALALAAAHAPLRPRNLAGPSDRPPPPGGGPFAGRQVASGAGGPATAAGAGGRASGLLGVPCRSAPSLAEHSL